MKTNKLTMFGILLSISLVLSYLELLLPVFVSVPGIKIGLANIITMFFLYETDFKNAFVFMLLRVVLSGFLFSGISTIVFGLSGGFICLLVMSVLKKVHCFSVVGVSMAGAISHNIGQLLVAALIMENFHILYYFSVLLISGIISGFFVGFITCKVIKNMPIYSEKN